MTTFCKWKHTTHQPKSDMYYFDNTDKAFDTNNSFEKHLLIRDFNTEISGPFIESLIYQCESHNLVKEKTCFKSVHNPNCIDVILASNTIAFHNTTTVSPE